MEKDLPKPHGWLATELDFYARVLAPCPVSLPSPLTCDPQGTTGRPKT